MPPDPAIADWGFAIPRRCPRCDHSLAGLPRPVCPECGDGLPPEFIPHGSESLGLTLLTGDGPRATVHPPAAARAALLAGPVGIMLGGFATLVAQVYGIISPFDLALGVTIGGVVFVPMFEFLRRTSPNAGARERDAVVEFHDAVATRAVLLGFAHGAYGRVYTRRLFICLESGSIIVLDRRAFARRRVDPDAFPTRIRIGWLRANGKVVLLRQTGPTIRVERSDDAIRYTNATPTGIHHPRDLPFILDRT